MVAERNGVRGGTKLPPCVAESAPSGLAPPGGGPTGGGLADAGAGTLPRGAAPQSHPRWQPR